MTPSEKIKKALTYAREWIIDSRSAATSYDEAEQWLVVQNIDQALEELEKEKK
jgi:hypothetical protein